mmetsp:Transcript_5262/g.24237  ORF Transcript_5262/g.24237 Transcript_5262/m.24237 type:complete len:368 (-) Transcript_5262:49-1152(-)
MTGLGATHCVARLEASQCTVALSPRGRTPMITFPPPPATRAKASASPDADLTPRSNARAASTANSEDVPELGSSTPPIPPPDCCSGSSGTEGGSTASRSTRPESASDATACSRRSAETFPDSIAPFNSFNTTSHAFAVTSPGVSGPTHVTPGTETAAAAAAGPPTAMYDATGTTPAMNPGDELWYRSAALSAERIPSRPSVATMNCATLCRDALAPKAAGSVHVGSAPSWSYESSTSFTDASSSRRQRTSSPRLTRGRGPSPSASARPRSIAAAGRVAAGFVPARSAASSDETFTTRRSRRSSPGRTPCRSRATPSVAAASAPRMTPNAEGDVTIAVIDARRTTATAGSRGRTPRLSRSNIIGDPPP